ncbi:enoyl-CoA hydratase-related protein [Cupriavidus necator]
MIKVAIEGVVAKIILNRAEKLNSLNAAMMEGFHGAVDRVAEDKNLRVLVVTGAGRAFCAGQDLNDPAMKLVDGSVPDIGNLVAHRFNPLVLKLQNLNIPTIAAVNGLAAGGGASLALACDLVVASRSAYFLQAFSRIGLTPDTGSTWFLPHHIGLARAVGLAMLADELSATEAANWGLIWRVLDDGEFASGVHALAQRIATMPTRALVRTRQLMRASRGNTLEQQLSMESTCIREMGWSRDYQEGVRAFVEKRKPKFVGE